MYKKFGDISSFLLLYLGRDSRVESGILIVPAKLQEFDSLPPSAPIYKLIGPVLLRHDRSEAVLTVNGRVEFIEKEMYVDLTNLPFFQYTSLGVIEFSLWAASKWGSIDDVKI